MKTSPEISELATALSKAQGTFTNPPRNRAVKVTLKAGGNYTFHYTTLDCIIDMVRPGLSANGLSFVQSVALDQDWVIVGTRLMHASGQWIEDELPVKPDGFGPQQVGSAITYGKRYLLAALLGIASDEDDDGNLGSGNTSEEMQRSPPPKRNGKKAEADRIAAEHGMTTADKLDPPKDIYGDALAMLEKYTKVSELITLADWVKEHKIAKNLNAKEYADLDSKIAAKACELPSNEKGFEAAEKLLRAMHGELRVTEGDYLQFCGKLADAKDAKLAQVA